jgi:hypothetical protein
VDWAPCVKELVEVHDPAAERMVLAPDNLNIPSPASLDEAFPPAEARRLADHHDRGRAHQAQAALPSISCLTDYY